MRYDELRPELHKERMAVYLSPNFRDPGRPGVHEALAKAAGTASEPEVLEALIAASGDEGLPSEVRGLLNVLVRMEKGEPVANLMLDGRFDDGNRDWAQRRLSGDRAYRGQNSLRLDLAPPHRSLVSLHQRDVSKRGAVHGWYLVSLMVYIEAGHNDVESYVTFRAIAREKEGRLRNVYDAPHVNVPPGEWTRISLVANMRRADIFDLQNIRFHNFSEGDVAYIDEVLVVPLGG